MYTRKRIGKPFRQRGTAGLATYVEAVNQYAAMTRSPIDSGTAAGLAF